MNMILFVCMELNELKGSVFSSLELASLRSSVRQDVGGGGGRGELRHWNHHIYFSEGNPHFDRLMRMVSTCLG